MRHMILMVTLVISLFFGSIVKAQDASPVPADKVEKKSGKETPIETIARLSVSPEGETAGEKRVRLKALEILLEQEAKRAKGERMKTLTPAEYKAEGQIAKEDKKEAKAIDTRRQSKINTGLVCKNEEDFDKVWVSESVGKNWFASTHSRMTIINPYDAPVQIRRVAGRGGPIVVDNLCPRGSITLQERLPVGDGFGIVAYSAVAVGSNGVGYSQSPQIYMNRCGGVGCQWEFFSTWQIQMQ